MRRVKIIKLAPTGEGVTRGADGVGFVAGALPGEEVEAEVVETRRSFWRGRAREILLPSSDRRSVPEEGCGGCDWPHYEVAAARRAKRELFLESMERIGRLPASSFGEVPVAISPLAYRLRNRFHVAGSGEATRVGAFAARSHRVVPVSSCDALTLETREAVRRAEEAIAASGARVVEVATLENRSGTRRIARFTVGDDAPPADRATLDGLADRLSQQFDGVRFERPDGRRLIERGARGLSLEVEGRGFSATVDVFFQSNRFAVEDLYREVRSEAQSVPPGAALDAFGGVGLLAGALLDAGHSVTSVEGDAAASREAARTRATWPDGERWRLVAASVGSFLAKAEEFPLIVVDPPRAGLGPLAGPLALLARRKLLYVSCEPATLARDLPVLLEGGLVIADARLHDMFPLTHRMEALVTLERE